MTMTIVITRDGPDRVLDGGRGDFLLPCRPEASDTCFDTYP
jgi:hypothetical protein